MFFFWKEKSLKSHVFFFDFPLFVLKSGQLYFSKNSNLKNHAIFLVLTHPFVLNMIYCFVTWFWFILWLEVTHQTQRHFYSCLLPSVWYIWRSQILGSFGQLTPAVLQPSFSFSNVLFSVSNKISCKFEIQRLHCKYHMLFHINLNKN